MRFCDQCENMLYISVDETDLVFQCKNCNFSVKEDCSSKAENIKNDLRDDKYSIYMNKHIKHDPTLPRVNNILCPNEVCRSKTEKDKKEGEVIYVKYNPNDMKYAYLCCHCDTFWKLDE